MALQRLLIIGFWAAALFALIMASLPKPPQLPGQPSDKVQHIIAFAVLAALAAAAYPKAPLLRILGGLCLFGAVIEIIQMIPLLHRDAELIDWAADTAAAAIILLIVGVARRRLSRR